MPQRRTGAAPGGDGARSAWCRGQSADGADAADAAETGETGDAGEMGDTGDGAESTCTGAAGAGAGVTALGTDWNVLALDGPVSDGATVGAGLEADGVLTEGVVSDGVLVDGVLVDGVAEVDGVAGALGLVLMPVRPVSWPSSPVRLISLALATAPAPMMPRPSTEAAPMTVHFLVFAFMICSVRWSVRRCGPSVVPIVASGDETHESRG